MPNFLAIGPTIAEIWQILDFSKMADAAILDFKNFKFLTVGRISRIELRHRAKFRRNQPYPVEMWRFFDGFF